MPRAKAAVKARVDAFESTVTAVGTSRDKSRSTLPVDRMFDRATIEKYYKSSKILRRLVHIYPEYALKEGFDLQVDESTDAQSLLADAFESLGVVQAVLKAAAYGRLYGGAAIIPITDDSSDLSMPLEPASVRQVRRLQVLSRHRLSVEGDVSTDITSDYYDLPEMYIIDGGQKIHATRVIRFVGDDPGELSRQQYNYWGMPVLNSVLSGITDYETAAGNVAAIIGDFLQTVYRFENLQDLIHAGKSDLVRERVDLIDYTRSVVNAVVLDTKENLEKLGSPVSGLADLFDRVLMRLTIDAQVPHTLLLGESPSGLGATGDSEKMDFYDSIGLYRNAQITPALQRIAALVMASRQGPTRGRVYPVTVSYPSLWKSSPKEHSETLLRTAQADQIYVGLGADADTLIEARFADGVFHQEIVIKPGASSANEEAIAAAEAEEAARRNAPPRRSDSDTPSPSSAMVSACRKALDRGDAGTPAQVARARAIAGGSELSPDSIKALVSDIARLDGADIPHLLGGPAAGLWSRRAWRTVRTDADEVGMVETYQLWFDAQLWSEQKVKNWLKNNGLAGGAIEQTSMFSEGGWLWSARDAAAYSEIRPDFAPPEGGIRWRWAVLK